MPDHNCQFQVTLTKNGHLLARTEWSDDKDLVIELMDSVNSDRRGTLRATVETKASGHVQLPRAIRVGG